MAEGEKDTRTLLERWFPAGYKTEQMNLLRLSWPIVINAFLENALHPMSVAFAGNLGKIELDSVALGMSLAFTFGITPGSGILGVCVTYFSQSYGSINQKQMGVVLQKGLYVIILMFLLSFAVFLNTNSILLLLGQNPEIAMNAELYLMFYMPCLLLRNVNQLLQRYLNAQNIVYPSMLFAFINNLVNAGIQYLFVYVLGWGIRGSAGAISVVYFINTIEHLAYIYLTGSRRDTWNGWSCESLLDWANFVKLGIANMLMVSVEWLVFEIGTILMGILGAVELGATVIMFQLWPMFGSVGSGLRDVIAVRVGQHLGAKNPLAALTVCRIAWINAMLVGVVTGSLILALRDFLPSIFTKDPDILELTAQQIPVLSIFSILVIIKWMCSGMIFGCGMHVIGGIVSAMSYILVAIPIGVPLMFLTNLRSFGYWWGLNAGLGFAVIAYFFTFNCADWDKEVAKAQKRAKVDQVINSAEEGTESMGPKPVKTKQIITSNEDACESSAKLHPHNARVGIDLSRSELHDYQFRENYTGLLRLEQAQQNLIKAETIAAYTEKVKMNGPLHSLKHMENNTQYGGIQTSQDQSPAQMSDTSENLSSYEWKKIYIFRAVNVLTCVLFVLFGLLCRYVLFIPPNIHSVNSTMSTNISERVA